MMLSFTHRPPFVAYTFTHWCFFPTQHWFWDVSCCMCRCSLLVLIAVWWPLMSKPNSLIHPPSKGEVGLVSLFPLPFVINSVLLKILLYESSCTCAKVSTSFFFLKFPPLKVDFYKQNCRYIPEHKELLSVWEKDSRKIDTKGIHTLWRRTWEWSVNRKRCSISVVIKKKKQR